MLSTGDVQGCLRKLEALLRVIKYPGYVDYDGLSKGDPSAFLPIVSFTLTSFSPLFVEELMAAGLELTGKTDLRFTDALYKALRDIFHYKPILSKQQFLQWGFSQRKISVICDIINLVIQKHSQLKKVHSFSLAYSYLRMCLCVLNGHKLSQRFLESLRLLVSRKIFCYGEIDNDFQVQDADSRH
uniref:Centrosomal protein of 44 kDa n=1 Tax=Amphiprion ocellaris TaxID=80972 RepID=A0A3Q1CDE5_AMPOC